jgi:glucosamine--fructose-6-phosphate aminotransferase (isomerizing)
VREQVVSLQRLIDRGRERAIAAAQAIAAARPRFVVIAARGTSDNAARYAQYLLGIHNGLTVALAAPSIYTRYGAHPDVRDALVIGISQSGQSPDLVTVVENARQQGALTLAITNDEGSPMAQAAAQCLPLHAGPERAVAATKTYTAELMCLAMLSAALEGQASRWGEIEGVPRWVEAAIAANVSLDEGAARFRDAARLVVVGRGWNFATAYETALKIKETSYAMAEPYSLADFLHGPVAMVDRSLPVLAIGPSGKMAEEIDTLVRLAREQRAPLVAISDRPEVLAQADVALPLPTGVPEWLSPLVAIVPGQLWAQALALSRGLHPDAPRGLSKVTHTL